jgi:hypothetical protein
MKIYSNGGKLGLVGQNNFVLNQFKVVNWDISTERPTQDVTHRDVTHQIATGPGTIRMTLEIECPAGDMKVYNQGDDKLIMSEVFDVPGHIPAVQIERFANRVEARKVANDN